MRWQCERWFEVGGWVGGWVVGKVTAQSLLVDIDHCTCNQTHRSAFFRSAEEFDSRLDWHIPIDLQIHTYEDM